MVNIKISGRPLDSISYKMVRACVTEGKDVHGLITHAVEIYERVIMTGVNVNPADLWLFCTALKNLAESLEKGMDDEQRGVYECFANSIATTTVVNTDGVDGDET